jgi:hypothetical protein
MVGAGRLVNAGLPGSVESLFGEPGHKGGHLPVGELRSAWRG